MCLLLMYKMCNAQGSYNAFNLVLSLSIFTTVVIVVVTVPMIYHKIIICGNLYVNSYCTHHLKLVSSINDKYQYSPYKCYYSVICIHIHSYETLANWWYYRLSFVSANTTSGLYTQTVFQHQCLAVFFVILLTKYYRFCDETDGGTKLKLHSMFDRYLLMNHHPVHRFMFHWTRTEATVTLWI